MLIVVTASPVVYILYTIYNILLLQPQQPQRGPRFQKNVANLFTRGSGGLGFFLDKNNSTRKLTVTSRSDYTNFSSSLQADEIFSSLTPYRSFGSCRYQGGVFLVANGRARRLSKLGRQLGWGEFAVVLDGTRGAVSLTLEKTRGVKGGVRS